SEPAPAADSVAGAVARLAGTGFAGGDLDRPLRLAGACPLLPLRPMTPRADPLSPIALRAWAPPPDWTPRRPAHSRGSWPQAAFLITTLARPVPGEPLLYGACALLASLLPGQAP